MSESQSVGTAAGSAGQGAASGASGASAAAPSALSSGASTAGQGAGGYSLGADYAANGSTEMGPALSPEAAQNIQTYDTTSPTIWDKTVNIYDRLNSGGEQNISQAYKNFGNNPETYGYALAKLKPLMSGGAPPSAPAMTTNITYQQPQNEYLRKFRRY